MDSAVDTGEDWTDKAMSDAKDAQERDFMELAEGLEDQKSTVRILPVHDITRT
jgi:hypothetical protein